MSTTPYTGTAPLGAVLPFPSRETGSSGADEARLRRFDLTTAAFERAMDLAAVVAAVLATHFLGGPWYGSAERFATSDVVAAGCGAGLLLVLLLDKHGAYRPCVSLLAVRETERLLRSVVTSSLVTVLALLAVTRQVPRRQVLATVALAVVFLMVEKWSVRLLVRSVQVRAGLVRKAVIVGTGRLGRKIFSALVRSPKLGIEPVAFVESDGPVTEPAIFESWYRRERQARVLSGPVSSKVLRRLDASVVIVADPGLPAAEMENLRREAAAAGTRIYATPERLFDESDSTEYLEVDGVMLSSQLKCRERRGYEAAKRAIDIALSAALLVLLAPMLLAVALAVKWTSRGPVIFRQGRVGRHGRRFEMYKFRTMYMSCARYACSPTSGRDPRITPVGRFLRHACIDELPQLVNVLRGEMSLVGPRPEMPFVVAEYETIHLRRLGVKPGITGLWQLSADRMSPIHHNISYDLYYLRHRSVFMDIAILLHTMVFAFRGV